MIEFGKRDVIAHDHHPHADVGQIEQPLGEVHGQAHAAVRGRMAGQHAGVHSNSGPGNALHERHVAVFVQVGIVVRLLLHDAEYAGWRFIAGRVRSKPETAGSSGRRCRRSVTRCVSSPTTASSGTPLRLNGTISPRSSLAEGLP